MHAASNNASLARQAISAAAVTGCIVAIIASLTHRRVDRPVSAPGRRAIAVTARRLARVVALLARARVHPAVSA